MNLASSTHLSPSARSRTVNSIAEKIGIDNWLRNGLGRYLHSGQRQLLESYFTTTARKTVWECSRRFGKSTLLCAVAVITAHRKPGSRIIYAAPTRKQAKNIVMPLMRDLFKDAPPGIAPVFHVQDMKFVFPNGSEIFIDGADDDMGNHLRGPKADLILADEFGFWRYCKYVIDSVLFPQTITCDGRIVLASTPSESVGHESLEYISEAQRNNSYQLRTIYDNPLLTQQQIDEVAEELGGYESTAFLRECLCQHVTEAGRAVIPEFQKLRKDIVFSDIERPQFFDTYVFMDLGLIDYTHVLFAYYHFEKAQIIIEDELCFVYENHTTTDVAEGIIAKEEQLWGKQKPKLRISDNDPQQLQDLSRLYKLHFAPAQKHDPNEDVKTNQVRRMFRENKIRIHERCKWLLFQLEVGMWNTRRTGYERIPGAGHLDGIDALRYGVRMVDYNKDPIPKNYGIRLETHNVRPEPKRSHYQEALKRYGLSPGKRQ